MIIHLRNSNEYISYISPKFKKCRIFEYKILFQIKKKLQSLFSKAVIDLWERHFWDICNITNGSYILNWEGNRYLKPIPNLDNLCQEIITFRSFYEAKYNSYLATLQM